MTIRELRLAHFRNYDGLILPTHPKINIFIGKNGQGKTNLLEAIYYLAMGDSFRTKKEDELVNWQAQWMRLSAAFQLEHSERMLKIECFYDSIQKKQWALNGVRYRRLEQMPERVAVVLFTPDDLSIVKGSPEKRRRFLDRELEGLNPSFRSIRLAYQRALSQRNECLREIRAGRMEKSSILPWNQSLAQTGSVVIEERLKLLRLLVPRARRIHAYMTRSQGRFDITYQSTLGSAVLSADQSTLQERFLSRLDDCFEDDRRTGLTSIGPHRDDLILYEKGRDLRSFGSQGQQRTAVLLLKLAEIEAYEKIYQSHPILLLDDVMSELDEGRRHLLMMAIINKNIQTFLTTTKLGSDYGKKSDGDVFEVKEGKIIRIR